MISDALFAWAVSLDPLGMRYQFEEVRRLVTGPPALHRYTSLMPEALVAAAARVCDEYGGKAVRSGRAS